MFQAAPYPPFSPDMLPPMMYPPFVAEKAKPPKVKAKKTTVKPKAEKEPKSSGGKATKAEKAATEGAGLSCLVYHSQCWEIGALQGFTKEGEGVRVPLPP